MVNSRKKWSISLFSAFLFVLVVNPYMYDLTNKLLGNILGVISKNGCPTTLGLTLHTIVFLLLVRYSMDVDLF